MNCNAAVSYDNHHWLVELELQAEARALNSQNLTWVTANRTCATVPVHGAPDIGTDQPLDMTYSAYRSLPLVHLEYLGNMGVAAALTISLTQNGRLWGMLTCHHNSPKNVTLRERELYEFIGRTISIKLPDLQRNEQQPVTSQTFLNQTSEAVVIAGADGRIQSVNRSFCEITGYTSQEAIGHNPSILQSWIHTAHFYDELWRSLSEKGRWKGEIWNRRKNGEVYPQLGSISIVRNDDGSIRNYVAVFSDVSKAKEAENNLFFAQNHDPLTGLPNRQYCLDKVSHVIAERAQAVPGVAVVFLDIDRFKLLNDARGHHTGDNFLRAVAQRLAEACPKNGLLCRWGADEFVLVLEQVTNRDRIAVIVQTLFNALGSVDNSHR